MREESWLNDYVFTVDEFFDATECKKHLRIAEELGFEEALVSSPTGSVRVAGLRSNDRVMLTSPETAEWIWERASDFVPLEFEGRQAVGINELFRLYRYQPGQQFDWHQDFAFEREDGEQSYLTLLIYLNDSFEGGETSFNDSYSEEAFDDFSVTPKAGMALFFEHPTYHKGELVTEGTKYVLRTDVMYGLDPDDEEGTGEGGTDEDADLDNYDDVDNW